MQSKRILLLLIFASVAGLIGIYLFSLLTKNDDKSQVVYIVVASRNIDMGKPIEREQLKLEKYSIEEVPPNAKMSVYGLDGRVAKKNINAQDVIFDELLFSANSKEDFTFTITAGKRAMSMSVNEISDVAGFIVPGNYVDVLSSSKNDSGLYNSKILLTRLLVLATAQNKIGSDDNKPKLVTSVTLELLPKEAVMLDAARMNGTLSLVLRNLTDTVVAIEEEGKAPPLTAIALKFINPDLIPNPIPPTIRKVEIIRGTAIQMDPEILH